MRKIWLLAALLVAAFFAAPVHAQQGLWVQPNPLATPTPNPIKHVIVIVQENRTLCNYFYGVSGVNCSGAAQLWPSGTFTPPSLPFNGGENGDNSHGVCNFYLEVDGSSTGDSGGTSCTFPPGGAVQAPNGWAQGNVNGNWSKCSTPNPNVTNSDQCAVAGVQNSTQANGSNTSTVNGSDLYVTAANRTSGTWGGPCTVQPLGTGTNCTNIEIYRNMATAAFGTLADEAFQTNDGPSSAAHFALATGQTGWPTALADQWQGGCAGLMTQSASTLTMTTAYPSPPVPNNKNSCADTDTIFDLVASAGLPVTYFYSGNGMNIDTNYWDSLFSNYHLCNPSGGLGVGSCLFTPSVQHIVNTNFTTIAAVGSPSTCSLPSLSYIMPTGGQSDHAGISNNGQGPLWVASLVNAVGGNAACWNSSAIIVVWDDWGGWWDSATPIQPNDYAAHYGQNDPYEYGFRVPFLVLSPYLANPGAVDHTVRNAAGSILAFTESILGLGKSNQCLGTFRTIPSGGIGDTSYPLQPSPCNHLGANDERNLGTQTDNLSTLFNLSRSPIAFSAFSMTDTEKAMELAYQVDHGATAARYGATPHDRLLGIRALGIAALAPRSVATRSTENDGWRE